MLVFWKERLVFLAVPKTGTTAIEGALAPRAAMVLRDPPHLKHSPIYRYRRFLVPFFEKAGGQQMETMAVIRHPVDWLSSWYRYRRRDDLAGQPNSTRGMTFDAFVAEYARGKPAGFANVGSQAKFVSDAEGRIAVDHLFRYEAPERFTGFLSERLAHRFELPRLNVSPAMEVSLSAATQAKLRRKCAPEFAAWEAAAG